jgi:glycosyltransferase involved in cell wall biosynthesis
MIWCYNQESFIAEAIQGALAQDYSPLEVVISDDGSSDSTFEVVRETVAAYRGPHRLVLNRNPKNLGLGGNANRALDLCRGELVVIAGGDDVSLPERTSRIVEAWNDSQRQSTSIYSRYTVIDGKGQVQPGLIWDCFPRTGDRLVHQRATPTAFVRRRRPAFCGCAHAISPRLYSAFGPLPPRISAEDTALAFRTILAHGLFTYINAPLVKYRWHANNTSAGVHGMRPRDAASFRRFEQKQRVALGRMVEVYNSFAADAKKALQNGMIAHAAYDKINRRIVKERRRFELRSQLLIRPWLQRLPILCELYGGSFRPREMLEHLPHLLPKELRYAVVTARNRRAAAVSS